jgi:ABC-2 type transport system permease protein
MSAVGVQPRQQVRGGVRDAYMTEMEKLFAQLTTRVTVLLALVGPFAFAAVLRIQSGTPSDALFGVWVHSSGFAISLVILGFAGAWGFPILAGVLAGDLFASEDRHRTWKTILTRSCTREDIYAGKLLAAGTWAIGVLAALAVSSLLAGVAFVGIHPLVNLSGVLTSSGRMFALTVVSWLICVLPFLAYTSLAILFSVATRNGIVGVLGPLLVALVTQLLGLVGKGVIVHLLLIGSAFNGYYGLFTSHPFFGPLLVSSLVSVIWIGAALTTSWWILRRRDFLAGDGGRPNWATAIKVVVASGAAIAVLAVACNLGPTGVTAYRVASAIGPEFNNATLLQQALIGRHAPPEAKLDVNPQCNRRAAKAVGPGDWTCNLYVYLPQPKSVPFTLTSVEYDVSIESNGCYKAQSPPAFIGGPTMRDSAGRTVTNPLYIVYGCFNIL